MFADALAALAGPVLVGVLFWIVMRAIVRADRNERAAYARIEAEERAASDSVTR